MKIFQLFCILVISLTIATKIGFTIQRVYVDIKGLALAAVLAVTAGIVSLGYPILAVFAFILVFLYCLCKIGEVSLLPDAILAIMISGAVVLMLIANNVVDINYVL